MQRKEKFFKPQENLGMVLNEMIDSTKTLLEQNRENKMKNQKTEQDLAILLNEVIDSAKLKMENNMGNLLENDRGNLLFSSFSSPKTPTSGGLHHPKNKIVPMISLKNKRVPAMLSPKAPTLSPKNKLVLSPKNKLVSMLSPKMKFITKSYTPTPTPLEEHQLFPKIKDRSPEHQMIKTYLQIYTNLDLDHQITECITSVQKRYEWTAMLTETPKKLISILGISKEQEFEPTLLKKHFINHGSYGFVLANNKTKEFPEKVTKISFGSVLAYNYNPLDFKEMPFEYCIGLLSPTTHLLRPIPNSFQPIQIPQFLFQTELELGANIKLKFDQPSIFNSMPIKDIPVVPMFEMPLCLEVNWSKVSKTSSSVFLELIHGLNEVHESGISMNDISEQNLMFCNGKIKFIDLGFANLYSKVKETFLDKIFRFGNQLYRSPWAHVVSEIPKNKFHLFPHWNLQEKSVLEMIANDFWSLAAVFGHAFCDFNSNPLFGTTFAHLEDIVSKVAQTISGHPTTEELNEMMQTNFKHIFDELETNLKIHPNCPKSLQTMLKSLLQVNPITRMKNVQDMLQVHRGVMNIQKTMVYGKVFVPKLEQKILQMRKQNMTNDLE